MLLLIIGLAMWSGLHFIPSTAISYRARLIGKWGETKYQIIFSVLIVASIAVMVLGWRSIVPVAIYTPPEWSGLITGLLVFITFILFSAANSKSNIRRFVRHSQLSGLIIWSIAHLLSNGDNRSLILFGALGAWAVAEIIFINKREGDWVKPGPASIRSELFMVIKGVAMFTVFFLAHPYLFGVSPIAQ
ncbi:MAG TPA: NnrU protein [Gammaproteobacteria bacterium]|nr:NnrU protein [Gammaproteobacteria bacterium]